MERESDILHEAGRFWVHKEFYAYVVYENGITHATSIQAFPLTEDGLSIAKAYCDYKNEQLTHLASSNILHSSTNA